MCDNTTEYGSNVASMVATDSGTGAEHWIFTLLPNGAYQIQSQQRKGSSCLVSMLSLQACYSPTVNMVGIDDGSGRLPAQPCRLEEDVKDVGASFAW